MNVYLVDGNSYFYRAFHAIKNLTNAEGFPTNAIYGFTTMLLKILKDRKPEAIAIALDSKELTERHHLYEQYKAQRPQMPDSLMVQIPRIKEVIEAFRIPMFQMPGYEADDIIATIACQCAEQNAHVFILTADKDMMQVVSERIKIYDPVKDTIIDESYVIERFGVPPDRVPEVMALMGDAVDNIPGVKGIGEKTAKALITKAGSLDKLLEKPEQFAAPRIAALIRAQKDAVQLSRQLATINRTVPVTCDFDLLRVREPDWPRLFDLFVEFGFKSLLKVIPANGCKPRAKYVAITHAAELIRFLGGSV